MVRKVLLTAILIGTVTAAFAQSHQGPTKVTGTLEVTGQTTFDNALHMPLIAALSGHTYCLQIDSAGNITNTGAACGGSGSGSVTSFAAPSASWPSWLVPTVTNSTTTPSLAVSASAIPNSALASSATTVNGQTCTLGSTCSVTAAAAGVSVGTTTVGSGTNGYILYNNAGTLGNLATTGAGSVVQAASPALTGVPTAPTAAAGTNTPQIATTSFVQNSLTNYLFILPASWSVQSTLFSTSTMLGSVYYVQYTSPVYPTMTVRLSGAISCTVAPIVNLMDLGVSPTTAYGSATSIGSVTTGTSDGVYGSGTAVIGGTVTTTGHYYGIAFSAGTCATAPTFDISVLSVW